jgi:hypothetical protein
MDQRTRTVRFLALLLALTWATLGAWLILNLNDAGAAGLIVAAWPFLPALISAAAALAPARGGGSVASLAAVGGLALLLAVSFAVTLAEPASTPGRTLIGASPAIAFGGAVAAAATTLFTTLAWRQRGAGRATAVALSMVVGIGAGAGLVLPAAGTAAAGCSVPEPVSAGRIQINAEGSVDGQIVARAAVDGERSSTAERWHAKVDGSEVQRWSADFVRVGADARLRRPGGQWQAVPADSPATAPGTLDGRLMALLAERAGPGVEDRGIELRGGEPLRHCRLLVSGSQALRAFEPLGWLIGREPFDPEPALEVWRGDLDWWLDDAGRLVAARIHLGGLASDVWPGDGPRGLLRADLVVSERDVPRDIEEPLP